MRKTTKTVLTVFIALLLALCALAFVWEWFFSISMLTLPELAPDAEFGESLGHGLSRGFLILFFVVTLIAHTALTLIGEILSILTACRADGKTRVFAIVSAVTKGVMLLTAFVLLFVIYM